MFDNSPDFFWLFIAYLTGSFATYFLFYKAVTMNAVEKTIDGLIENGYLKTRGSGQNMEIVPWKNWCDESKEEKEEVT